MPGIRRPALEHPAPILFCITLIMLLAGLWPFRFSFPNKAHITQRGMIRFSAPSFAYDDKALNPLEQKFLSDSNYSLDLTLNGWPQQRRYVARIITLVNGGREHVVVGQWKTHLIVYATEQIQGKRIGKTKELPVFNAFAKTKDFHLSCLQYKDTLLIYVNGELKRKAGQVKLFDRFPSGNNRFMFGSTQHGKFGYSGEFGEFRISRSLMNYKPDIEFTIGQRRGDGAHAIIVPKEFPLFLKPVLAYPWHDFTNDASYWSDIAVNLVGFLPFGFFMAAAMSARYKMRGKVNFKKVVIFTTIAGTAFSLTIELSQVFMPLRTSQLSDLINNGLGTMIGAILLSVSLKSAPCSTN